jgi:hypothetical protein
MIDEDEPWYFFVASKTSSSMESEDESELLFSLLVFAVCFILKTSSPIYYSFFLGLTSLFSTKI